MSEYTPRYNHVQPEGWTPIIDQAAAILAADGNVVTADGATDLLGYIDNGYDNSDLDDNRYYSLGRGVCNVARIFADPTQRQQVIQGGAASLAAYQQKLHAKNGTDGTAGLRLSEIKSDRIGYGFQPLVAEAVAQLPAAEVFALDALTVVAGGRRPFVAGESPYHALPYPTRGYAHYVVDAAPGVESIASAAFAGAAYTAAMTLQTHYKIVALSRGMNAKDAATANPLLHEIASEAAMRQIITGKGALAVAMGLARLRHDEFTFAALSYIKPDTEHTVRFDRAAVPKRPTPQPLLAWRSKKPTTTIRDERFICPAAFVPGMIEMAMGIVPDILFTANTQIRSASA